MVVSFPRAHKEGHESHIAALVFLTAVLLIPALLPDKVGWLASLVPLPIFYYLAVLGRKKGETIIRNAILLSVGGALIIGSLPAVVFSLTMVPAGYSFYLSLSGKRPPVDAGFKGFLVLIIAWSIFWSGLGLIHQANPYAELLSELDRGLVNGLAHYEQTAELEQETLERIRNAVSLMRTYIPKILPGIILSAAITIIWLNLVLGNWLLRRKRRDLTGWPDFSLWKLPEKLVWLIIASGAAVFILPPPLNIFGINFLLACITVYFFQGLAIITSLLNKWSVPLMLRILIYALIFIQTYGIIILFMIGLADVWADFRKLEKKNKFKEGNM